MAALSFDRAHPPAELVPLNNVTKSELSAAHEFFVRRTDGALFHVKYSDSSPPWIVELEPIDATFWALDTHKLQKELRHLKITTKTVI